MVGSVLDAAGIVALIVIVGFFFVMLRYRRPPGMVQPQRDLAYEWVAERADRADSSLRTKFAGAAPAGGDVTLVRIGFFNGGRTGIDPDQMVKPLALIFPEGAEILLARFGESVKNDRPTPPPPVVTGARVEFPPFAIASGGVVVFDIAVRGARRPSGVEGVVTGLERIRRLG